MKSAFTLLFTLLFIASIAQTPFLNYYGKLGESTRAEHFMLLADGTAQLFGTGRQNGERLSNVYTLSIDQTGMLRDSVRWQDTGSEAVQDLQQAPDGTTILVLGTREEDRLLSDIVLVKLDAGGTEVDRMLIQDEVNVNSQATAIDSNGNFYLVYTKRLENGASDQEWRLRKVNAAFITVYDRPMVLESAPFVSVLHISALPDGGLVYTTREFLRKFDADGDLLWAKDGFDNFGLLEFNDVAASPEGQIYITDLSLSSLWEIDSTTGDIGTELRLAQRPGAFLLDDGFFFRDGDLWFKTAENGLVHYRLAEDNNYVQVGAYHHSATPGFNSDLIVDVKPETDSTWLVMSVLPSKLLRFWPTTARFETLYEPLELFVDGYDWGRHLAGDGNRWWLTVSNLPGNFNNRFEHYSLAADGALLEPAWPYGVDSITQYSDVLPLSNGKSVELRLQTNPIVNNPLSVRFYTADQQLEGELFLPIVVDAPFDIQLYPLQQLSDNVILAPVWEADFVNNFPLTYYQIDVTTREIIGSQTFGREAGGESERPHQIAAIDESSFIVTYEDANFRSEVFRIRQVDTRDGIVWRNDLTAPAGLRLPPATDHNSVHLSPLDPSLLYGVPYNDFFRFTFLDPMTGDSLNSFDTFLSHGSAVANFRRDGSLQLAGSNINPFSTGADDLYSLYLEHYSREGELLETVVHHLPYDLVFTELQRLENGLFATFGAAFTPSESDAFLVIFNETGDITTSTLSVLPTTDQLRLAPNPSSGPLQLRLDNNYHGPLDIALYNLQGQQLGAWSDTKRRSHWQWSTTLTELPAATYLVRVQTGKGALTQLWSKQN